MQSFRTISNQRKTDILKAASGQLSINTGASIQPVGTAPDVLRPGLPAMYLYHGNLIRTSTVQAILEASASHVRFETLNSIYTISYNNQLGEGFRVTA